MLTRYVCLKKPANAKHFLFEVKGLSILLSDYLLSDMRIMRSGPNPLTLPVEFNPKGTSIALKTTNSNSVELTTGKEVIDCFWNPLVRIDESAQIRDLRIKNPGKLDKKHLHAIEFTAPDRKRQVGIENGTTLVDKKQVRTTVVTFSFEPGIVSAERIRELACDVATLLRLGYAVSVEQTHAKINAITYLLKELSKATSDDGEMKRRLFATTS